MIRIRKSFLRFAELLMLITCLLAAHWELLTCFHVKHLNRILRAGFHGRWVERFCFHPSVLHEICVPSGPDQHNEQPIGGVNNFSKTRLLGEGRPLQSLPFLVVHFSEMEIPQGVEHCMSQSNMFYIYIYILKIYVYVAVGIKQYLQNTPFWKMRWGPDPRTN